jgi:transcriptional regulator with XRE-family HTH domain
MSLKGPEIRTLRQRLGWSLAEMARRMGCKTKLIQKWEAGQAAPDMEAMNQLHYLRNHVESNSELIAQRPHLEREMEERRMAQLTHRDLLKDIQ